MMDSLKFIFKSHCICGEVNPEYVLEELPHQNIAVTVPLRFITFSVSTGSLKASFQLGNKTHCYSVASTGNNQSLSYSSSSQLLTLIAEHLNHL